MNDLLPSAQVWMGKQVADPAFLVGEDPEVKRYLADPHCYGSSILLDACRFDTTTNYFFDFWNRYDRRTKQRRSLQGAVEGFLDQGKVAILYGGGKHKGGIDASGKLIVGNAALFEEKRQAGDFIKYVENCVSLFKDYRDTPLFWLALDGGDPELAYAIHDLGYQVMVEGAQYPGHPCRGFPSITSDAQSEWNQGPGTAADPRGDYEKLPADVPHRIWATSDEIMARNVQKWLAMGRVIHAGYVGHPQYGPKWWPAAVA